MTDEFAPAGSDVGEGFEVDSSVALTREKWIQAQRDLVTTTLDYNLQAIVTLISDETIDLSPSFQRRDRWDRVRQSQLIESFLMNVPLPPIFLNEDDYGVYSIIDGKQRLTAISEFMSDGFALRGLEVFSEAEGLTFSQLDRELRGVLATRASLRAVIILRMSDPEIKYQVFQRLNTGGVRLNAQELRNVAFAGAMNDALVDMSRSLRYERLLGIAEPSDRERSALWKQMRDVELVLRFLTLKDSWTEFSGSLVGEMNRFLIENRHADSSVISDAREQFDTAITKIASVFGETAFRRFRPDTRSYGLPVLASLFDAQMIGLMPFSSEALKANAQSLQEGMQDLFMNERFLAAIGAQTNTPRSVVERITMVRDMVSGVLGQVEA